MSEESPTEQTWIALMVFAGVRLPMAHGKAGHDYINPEETLVTSREELIVFMKRVNPILHEPLATKVAEEWADKFMDEFEKAHTPTDGARMKVSDRLAPKRARRSKVPGAGDERSDALAEALAVLESHEPGEADQLERIYRAGNILRAALQGGD